MEYVLTILMMYSSPKAVPAQTLATEIMKVSAKYGINEKDLVRIVMVESAGDPNAINRKSNDYGIAQINIRTAKAMKVPMFCLKDWKCNLDTAGRLIKQQMRSKYYRICHYNTGPKKKACKYCLMYEAKLAKIN